MLGSPNLKALPPPPFSHRRVHKGLPGLFLEKYCHTDDLARAAADFPELNFIAFHSAFPWQAELARQAKAAKVKNLYAALGSLARLTRTDPASYAVLIGNLLDGFGPDHILWGTDTPVIGPPQWQIEAFRTFTIPDELATRRDYLQLTPKVKNKIFGENPVSSSREFTSKSLSRRAFSWGLRQVKSKSNARR